MEQGTPALGVHHEGPVLPQQSPTHRKRARRRQANTEPNDTSASAVKHFNPMAALTTDSQGDPAWHPSNGNGPSQAMPAKGIDKQTPSVGDSSAGSSAAGTPIKSAFAAHEHIEPGITATGYDQQQHAGEQPIEGHSR